jgi:hypothetical protein
MSETETTGIEAIGPLAGQGNAQMNVNALTAETAQEVIAAGNLSFAMEDAMSGVLTMPGIGVDTLTYKDRLTGAPSDEVTREKVGLMSDSQNSAQPSGGQTEQDALMARYEKLYTDMTVFQVAWSIARRVQQDTTQLLRGQ